MTRDFERQIFGVLRRRQEFFLKVFLAGLGVSALLAVLSFAFGWPLFFSLLPIGLVGPFAVTVISARCPRCNRLIHRSPLQAFRPLQRCARCGYRD